MLLQRHKRHHSVLEARTERLLSRCELVFETCELDLLRDTRVAFRGEMVVVEILTTEMTVALHAYKRLHLEMVRRVALEIVSAVKHLVAPGMSARKLLVFAAASHQLCKRI